MAWQLKRPQNKTPVVPPHSDTNDAHAAGQAPIAPVKEISSDLQRQKGWGRSGYGSNANLLPPSIEPGTQANMGSVSEAIRAASDADGALSSIIRKGIQTDSAVFGDPEVGWEERRVAGDPQKPSWTMRDRNEDNVRLGDNPNPSYIETEPEREPDL